MEVYWGYDPLSNLLQTSWDIQVSWGCLYFTLSSFVI